MKTHITVGEIQTLMQQATRLAVKEVLAEDPKRLILSTSAWLTLADICQMTGYTKKTVSKWIKLGYIRMSKPGEAKEMRTTPQMWDEDSRRLISKGMVEAQPNRLERILQHKPI